jgi:hypothetical protein
MRASRIIAAATAGLLLIGGGTAAGAAIAGSGPVDANGVIHGCWSQAELNGSHVLVLQDAGSTCPPKTNAISWSETGPAGPAGPAGPQGTPGTNGTNGTDGTNGNSFLTSATAPTGACNNGDSDVALDTDEVWTCASGGWTDTGSNIKGSQGAAGEPGPSDAYFTAGPTINTLSSTGSTEIAQLTLPAGSYTLQATVSSTNHATTQAALQCNFNIGYFQAMTLSPFGAEGDLVPTGTMDMLAMTTIGAGGGTVGIYCDDNPGGSDVYAQAYLEATAVGTLYQQ